ncbi:secondary thiamine-phosphate synthase enzyme YjbQ [Lachnospiraceae bacterium 45-P1]
MKVELITKILCADMEEQLIKITDDVKEAVENSGVKDGVVFVISAHTTAGITMNEGLPCVEKDLIGKLDKMVPYDDVYAHNHFLPSYGATGGNSPGHIKSMLVGNHCVLPVRDGKLVVGHAQDIYFAEFDGIKNRKYYIEVMGE